MLHNLSCLHRRCIQLVTLIALWFSGVAFGQTITMGSLSFAIATQSGQVVGLKNFKWNQTPLAAAEQTMPLAITYSGACYSQFTLIHSTSSASQAVVRLAPVGAAGVEMRCVFMPASQNISTHAFAGFKYRYEIVSTTPGCEISERTRWNLGATTASGTYFIRSVYRSQEYKLGGTTTLSTYTTKDGVEIPHSRFGKMQASDYHYIPGKGFMLVYFDGPALILNGKKATPAGVAPEDFDQYFAAQPQMSTPWKYVLLHESTQNLTNEQQMQDFMAVNNWVDNYYRQQIGYAANTPKPFLWTSPRFSRVQGMLPDIQRLGFKRLYIGPMWKSSATEGGSLSAMSVYDFVVADKWGGINGLTSLCADAHKYGIEVVAWMPFVHLSTYSPVLVANPSWRALPIRSDLYNDLLKPLDLTQSAVRNYILQKLQVVRNAGLDGLWLDSYHNYGIEVYQPNGVARIPQARTAVEFQKQIQDLGFTLYIEGASPYGIPSCMLDSGRLQESFSGAEYRSWLTSFNLEKEKTNANGNNIGSDMSGVPYWKFAAWSGPIAVKTLVNDTNALWENFTDADLAQLSHDNRICNLTLDTMRGIPEILPASQAVRWSNPARWLVYVFQDGSLASTAGDVIVDLETMSYFTSTATISALQNHVYMKVSAMPLFNDSFETGNFTGRQGAGASWTVTGNVTVQNVDPLDRTYSAVMTDTDSATTQSLVAVCSTMPGMDDYSLTFRCRVDHDGTFENKNWVALRNGLSDFRLRFRWHQGNLEFGPSWTNWGSYQSNQEIEYKCILSETAGTYSLYASNGASVTSVPVEGVAVNGINRLAFSSGTDNASRCIVTLDNVTFKPATALIADNFESGNFNAPQGIAAVWVASTGATVQTNPVLSGSYSARLYDGDGSGTQTLVGTFVRTSGSDLYRLSFDSQVSAISSASHSNYVMLRNGLGDVRVQFRWKDGALQHGQNWVTIGSYTSGSTAHVEVTVDERTASYAISVNNVVLVSRVPLQGRAFDGVDRVEFNSGTVAVSQVDWVIDSVGLKLF